MINNVPVIDLHLFRLGSTLTPLKKVLSFINSTASQFIEQMVNPNRFYTYAYLREDRTPYYIGKGTARRLYKRSKKDIKPPKDKSRIIFLKQNLTEQEAFQHEKYMIAVFGRKDLGTGILHNKTDGGDGPSNPSEETRKKMRENRIGKTSSEKSRNEMSESRRGNKNHFYGKHHTEETKAKLREANTGKTLSEQTKLKISESGTGKILSEQARENIKQSKLGEKNPFYGKSHSEKTRIKQSVANIGKKWWNDCFGNTKFMVECPGEGWVLGRGKLK
jgi:hypothetical protein